MRLAQNLRFVHNINFTFEFRPQEMMGKCRMIMPFSTKAGPKSLQNGVGDTIRKNIQKINPSGFIGRPPQTGLLSDPPPPPQNRKRQNEKKNDNLKIRNTKNIKRPINNFDRTSE